MPKSFLKAASALMCLATLIPASAAAQSTEEILEDALRTAARETALGNAFQSLSIFGAAPGVSAAEYFVDDGESEAEIDLLKFSPSHEFDPVWGGVKPYVEVTGGWLQWDEKFEVELVPSDPTGGDVEIEAFTVLAGAGVSVPVTETVTVRPIALFGYSRITDEADISGPFAGELSAAAEGILFDVEIESLLYGGALELAWADSFEGDINAEASARYDHLYDNVIDASDPVLDSSDDFIVLSANSELDGPIGLNMFGRELRWIGFAGATYLPGDQGDALGFDLFFQTGGGIEIVERAVIRGIEGVSLRASAIFGDNVTGYTLGGNIEF